jgi:hypothetical protein
MHIIKNTLGHFVGEKLAPEKKAEKNFSPHAMTWE